MNTAFIKLLNRILPKHLYVNKHSQMYHIDGYIDCIYIIQYTDMCTIVQGYIATIHFSLYSVLRQRYGVRALDFAYLSFTAQNRIIPLCEFLQTFYSHQEIESKKEEIIFTLGSSPWKEAYWQR